MSKLDGKIALTTSGIGAATAKRFPSEGAAVSVTGSNPATLEAARKTLHGLEVIASEAGDTAAVKSLIDT